MITGCTKDMLVFQEESFGPLINIATFSTEQEAVELANDTIWDSPRMSLPRTRRDSGGCSSS